jgi:hypothetical protein
MQKISSQPCLIRTIIEYRSVATRPSVVSASVNGSAAEAAYTSPLGSLLVQELAVLFGFVPSCSEERGKLADGGHGLQSSLHSPSAEGWTLPTGSVQRPARPSLEREAGQRRAGQRNWRLKAVVGVFTRGPPGTRLSRPRVPGVEKALRTLDPRRTRASTPTTRAGLSQGRGKAVGQERPSREQAPRRVPGGSVLMPYSSRMLLRVAPFMAGGSTCARIPGFGECEWRPMAVVRVGGRAWAVSWWRLVKGRVGTTALGLFAAGRRRRVFPMACCGRSITQMVPCWCRIVVAAQESPLFPCSRTST